MPIGVVHTVLVCVPSDVTQAPCPGGHALNPVQAYLIDPGQAASIEAQNEPFDYGYAAAIWGFVFTFVVSLYLVSRSAGAIVTAIKNL